MSGELIVIDGPAGAGKSTVARRLAARLGGALLDTGAIYRSLAWLARERGVDWDDEAGLAELAVALELEFVPPPAGALGEQRVRVAGPFAGPSASSRSAVDVTQAIRSAEMSEGASKVSRHPQVRRSLLTMQRAIAAQALERGPCVAEGRDMGTVVFPDARHKFFLTASPATRAERRHDQLVERGVAELSRDEVRRELELRDQRDSSRPVAPLRPAADAVHIDSSELDVDAVIERLLTALAGPG